MKNYIISLFKEIEKFIEDKIEDFETGLAEYTKKYYKALIKEYQASLKDLEQRYPEHNKNHNK